MPASISIDTPLRSVCGTAARALRCSVHGRISRRPGARECRVAFDPAAGICVHDDAPGGPSDAPVAVVAVEFGDGGFLAFERPAARGAWLDAERALMESFAELAGAVLVTGAGESPRQDGDPAARIDPGAYFRTIFDHADAMIWVQDPDTGEFLETSRRASEVAGYTVEEFKRLGPQGVAWGEPPYAAADAMRHLQCAREMGAPHRFEWCSRHRDGRPFFVEVTLRLVTLNGASRLLATGRWIDDRKAAEAALLRANEELERRVAERTTELGIINEQLEQRTLDLAQANEQLERRVKERTEALAVANETLRSSEEHFRRLIEHAHDVIVIVDGRGTALYGSPSVRHVLGYAPDAILGTPVDRFIHEDDLDRVRAWLAGLTGGAGGTHRAEFRFRHGEGRWVYLEAVSTSSPVGEPGSGHVVNLRDVTERRQAEEERRRTEEYYRTLIECAHDMITVVDEDGCIRFQSPSARALLGYEPEELVGKPVFAFVHPDDLAMAGERMRRVFANPGASECVQYRFRHKDGSWRHLESIGRTVLPDSTAAGAVGNVRDITERLEAERALRESEERFRTLTENAHDIIAIVDATTGRLSYQSAAMERVLGYSPDDLDGKDSFALVHPDDRDRVAATVQAAVKEPGTTRRAEYRYRHRDGSWRFVETFWRTLSPTSAGDGLVFNTRDITERREAELAVKESEAKYRSLIDAAQDMISVLDGDGTMHFSSPSVRRVLGYDPGEMVGRSAFDFMHPDDVEASAPALLSVMNHPGTIVTVEHRFRHRDGTWRHLESRGRTILPESAEAGAVVTSRDITERMKGEAALRESEERFRMLTENAHDIVVIIDGVTGRLTYQSPSMQRILGYAPEDLEGRDAIALVHPDDLERIAAAIGDAMAHPGETRHAEYRYRHRNGSWRHLETFGRTLSPASADDGLVFNTRDVTERKEAELAVKESEEHFRRLIENGNDLLMISAADGAITYVSPSAQRLLGYEPESMLSLKPSDILHPDDIGSAVDAVQKIVAKPGVAQRANWRMRHRDGSWRHFEAIGKTLAADSAEAGIVVNGRDVTERRAAEEALQLASAEAERARADAERANRAKSEFLSRMSHELRTPLNSILGFAQVLEDVEMAPEYRAGLRHILSGGRHLLRLINEVLDIARIEADQQALSLEPVRLGAVVREAVDMVRPLAAARGIRVAEIADMASDRFVQADRQRLAQVLLNLLSNAVKYNRPRGNVWLTYAQVRDPDGAGWLRVRVEDQGSGIPPEHQDRLFVPFARLGAEQTGVEGTGLGLALSRHLARAMGGTLALERTGIDGSVFRLDLCPAADPLSDVGALVAEAASASSHGATAGTLLYVEDNLANLSLVETILLPRPQWRLVPALQGRLGLELAVEHSPDVILLDLHLPDMPGREVLRCLRANPRTAHIPVVVITADATAKTADALLADGADAFLTKPLGVGEFLGTVERLLARPSRPE